MVVRILIILVLTSLVVRNSANSVVVKSDPEATFRLLRSINIGNESDNMLEMTVFENPNQCLCVKSECGCCFNLDVPEISLNCSGCLEVAYLSQDIGLAVSFTFDGRTLLNTSVSVKHPPPLCIMIPFLANYGHICLEFYKVDFSSTHYAACVKIDVAIWPFCPLPFELGCFHIDGVSSMDNVTFTRMQNKIYLLEDANDEVWRKSHYPWKYSVCSSDSNHVSNYQLVALMSLLLFAVVYYVRNPSV